MYKRYSGNTGRYVNIPENEPFAELPHRSEEIETNKPYEIERQRPREISSSIKSNKTGLPLHLPFEDALGGLIKKLNPEEFETEDLLLLLILYLMYRETGDKELLMIIGAMFLL